MGKGEWRCVSSGDGGGGGGGYLLEARARDEGRIVRARRTRRSCFLLLRWGRWGGGRHSRALGCRCGGVAECGGTDW